MSLKYRNEAVVVLSIPLDREYSVWAMANKPKDAEGYNVKLWLKERTIGTLNEIEGGDTTLVSSTKEIRANILKYVEDLHNKGFFEEFIRRNEFEIDVFNAGVRYYEGLVNEDSE